MKCRAGRSSPLSSARQCKHTDNTCVSSAGRPLLHDEHTDVQQTTNPTTACVVPRLSGNKQQMNYHTRVLRKEIYKIERIIVKCFRMLGL